MLNQFEHLIIKYGRQKEFLKFLEVIQTTNGKPNPSMQRMVLSLFIQEKINTYMLYMNDDIEPEFIFEEAEKKNLFYKDEPYEYHVAVLNVLSCCGLGVTGMLLIEAKCRNVIKLKNIFDVLMADEDKINMKIKLAMLDFFYNIYLDCEIMNLELKSFSDFFKYIYTQSKTLDELTEISEEYLHFLKIWVKILSKYRMAYIKNIYSSYYEQDDIKAIRIFAESLSNNSEKFKYNLSKDLLEEICEFCNLFDINFNKNNYESDESFNRLDSESISYYNHLKDDKILQQPEQLEK